MKQVLDFLLRKMRESTEQWSAREIGYALVGMSGLQQSAGESQEVANIVSEINLKLSLSELQEWTVLPSSFLVKDSR